MRYSELTLDDWLNLVDATTFHCLAPARQCEWETIESRKGACDGGDRCRNQATTEVNGIPYCNKHGMN